MPLILVASSLSCTALEHLQDANAFGSALVTGIHQQCGCADLEEIVQLAKAYCTQVGIDIGPTFSFFLKKKKRHVVVVLVLVQANALAMAPVQVLAAVQVQGLQMIPVQALAVAKVRVLAVPETLAQITDLLLSKYFILSLGSTGGILAL